MDKVELPVKLLRVGDLAEMFACSEGHIWNMVNKGIITPPIRLNRSVRWRMSDILAAIDSLPTYTGPARRIDKKDEVD